MPTAHPTIVTFPGAVKIVAPLEGKPAPVTRKHPKAGKRWRKQDGGGTYRHVDRNATQVVVPAGQRLEYEFVEKRGHKHPVAHVTVKASEPAPLAPMKLTHETKPVDHTFVVPPEPGKRVKKGEPPQTVTKTFAIATGKVTATSDEFPDLQVEGTDAAAVAKELDARVKAQKAAPKVEPAAEEGEGETVTREG